MNGFGILLYLEDTMDICRFLIQVLAHPHYSAHAESSNKHITVLLNSFAEKMNLPAASSGVSGWSMVRRKRRGIYPDFD